MTTPRRPRPGDTITATVDDTTGQTITTTLTVHTATQLGCGCWRLRCHRPGPDHPDACEWVEPLTGCGWHPTQITQGDNQCA